MLLHPYIQASADTTNFNYCQATNSMIFNKKADLGRLEYKSLHEIVRNLVYTKEVVPFRPLLRALEEMQHSIQEFQGSPAITPSNLDRLQLQANSIHAMFEGSKLDTTTENQLNNWFCKSVMSELRENFRLAVHAHQEGFCLPESIPCIYGKSQPDLCFYAPRRNNGKVVGGIMLRAAAGAPAIDNEEGVIVTGGITEFKRKNVKSERALSQVGADLVRYGVYLVEECLKRGENVDCIQILGILASHDNWTCIPFKLQVDLLKNVTDFFQGSEILLETGFVDLVCNVVDSSTFGY